MEIDRKVIARGPQASDKGYVVAQSADSVAFRNHDHFVQMRIVRNDGCRQRLNDVAEVSVREVLAQGTNRGRREDNVADLAQANQKDPFVQGSTVASSTSMTGMSSLMGYTRLHVAHFNADPFLTSVTGVLQFGQAKIASRSGSTAMRRTI